MDLITISDVSKRFDISTRTLRYYEQIGLISSTKKEDYAYRAYDKQVVLKIQQIIILRKLSISLKQIKSILQSTDALSAVSVFQDKLAEIGEEMDSLATIKSIIELLIDNLNQTIKLKLNMDIFNDEKIVKVLNSITPINNLKEKKTMEKLSKASENQTDFKNVRIIYLPPATVASSHFIGDNPEDIAGDLMDTFIIASELCIIKPDLRLYGFNNPNPDEKGNHGYEFWVTIPDDFDVSKPLDKKQFAGGLYAAHCIKMGDFHEWQTFGKWMHENKEYEYDKRESLEMDGTLEEHLNAYNYYKGKEVGKEFIQLDLLIPIKKLSLGENND